MPFVLYQEDAFSFTIIIFLKLSDTFFSEADSCSIFSASGTERADWM